MKNRFIQTVIIVFLFITTFLKSNAQVGLWANAGVSYPGMVMAMVDNLGLQAGGVYSTPEPIRAMAVYNGVVYSGGYNIGGVTHVYDNGFPLTSISGGGPITSMIVYNNELYVGGLFDSINGIAVNNIAKYNGSTWSAVGVGVGTLGLTTFVYSLGVYNGALYAGTNFGPCYKWDGTSWTTVGNFNSSAGGTLIRGFGVYNGSLYAGGFFESVNGVNAVNLARYDGNFWYSEGDIGIAGDPGNGISVLQEFNGSLYCGGNFGIAGGTTASCIARYTNGNWQALGTGTNGVVNALAVSNNQLYVAGNFTTAGGITVSNVAKWFFCTPPAATITYTGAPVVCNPGGSLLLSANTGAGLTYQWKSGGSIIGGATSSSYLVGSAGGIFSVIVTNPSGCSTTSAQVGISTSFTSASASPFGPISVCSGSGALLTAYVNAGYTYQWKKNGVAIAGATASTYTATTTGSYTVDETAGVCTKTSNAVSVTVNALPSATITPNGNLNFCTGAGITLQANIGAGLTYQWRKNSVNIAGATNSSYLANSTGAFNVVVTNSSGCSKGATPVNVTSPPSITITPSGATHFCNGGSVTLTATSGQTVTYKWKKNGAYIAGATNSSYVVTTTGSYNCVVTNSFGCSKGGTAISVTGPPSAVIAANGPTTFCAGGSVQLSAASGYTYQWIKNSGNINGATLQNYTATTAGNYKVKVTDPFGCSKTTPNSNQITVSVPCREGHISNEMNNGISIYPNPSSDDFTLHVNSNKNPDISLAIHDITGRIVFSKDIYKINNDVKFGNQFSAGIYYAEIFDGKELRTIRIVKTK